MKEDFSFVFTNNNKEEPGFVRLNNRKPYKKTSSQFDHMITSTSTIIGFDMKMIVHLPPHPPT